MGNPLFPILEFSSVDQPHGKATMSIEEPAVPEVCWELTACQEQKHELDERFEARSVHAQRK